LDLSFDIVRQKKKQNTRVKNVATEKTFSGQTDRKERQNLNFLPNCYKLVYARHCCENIEFLVCIIFSTT
jgi:hypothetical protein